MPLYVYTCRQGHTAEERRAIASRDDETFCRRCLEEARRRDEAAAECAERARMTRQLARVQRPILRPLGYSLYPGDKGYWNLPGGDAKHGASATAHPVDGRSRPRVAPFARAEDFHAHPPKIAGDDEPVYL